MKKLTEFTETIQGEEYSFVVARDEIGNRILTLKGSKKKIASVFGQGGHLNGGRRALQDVINRHGEARVRSVLWTEANNNKTE